MHHPKGAHCHALGPETGPLGAATHMQIDDYSPAGSMLFASELSGTTFVLTDTTLYSPDSDDQDDPPSDLGEPQYGNWLLVEVDGDETLMAAPGELIEELQTHDASVGDCYEVTRCAKSGRKKSDPYEVNLVEIDPDQARLDE